MTVRHGGWNEEADTLAEKLKLVGENVEGKENKQILNWSVHGTRSVVIVCVLMEGHALHRLALVLAMDQIGPNCLPMCEVNSSMADVYQAKTALTAAMAMYDVLLLIIPPSPPLLSSPTSLSPSLLSSSSPLPLPPSLRVSTLSSFSIVDGLYFTILVCEWVLELTW